jgi:hypothetical protein
MSLVRRDEQLDAKESLEEIKVNDFVVLLKVLVIVAVPLRNYGECWKVWV